MRSDGNEKNAFNEKRIRSAMNDMYTNKTESQILIISFP